MYKLTRGEDIPCWYDLSWQQKGPMAIIFKLHQEFIEKMRGKSPQVIIDGLMKIFNFSQFNSSFDGDFGFENTFLRLREKDNFVSFMVKIPRIKNYLYDPCPQMFIG